MNSAPRPMSRGGTIAAIARNWDCSRVTELESRLMLTSPSRVNKSGTYKSHSLSPCHPPSSSSLFLFVSLYRVPFMFLSIFSSFRVWLFLIDAPLRVFPLRPTASMPWTFLKAFRNSKTFAEKKHRVSVAFGKNLPSSRASFPEHPFPAGIRALFVAITYAK